MAAITTVPLPPTNVPWIDDGGRPNQSFALFMSAFAGGALPVLTNAVNDTAAAAAGVPVNHMYRNGSVLMVRIT